MDKTSLDRSSQALDDASSIFISDKATSTDLLGYKIFTDPIATRISQLNASDTPLTIGVFGEWGSGKTSFLEMVRTSLKNNYNIDSIVFNAWKYEKEDNLWSALLQCILNHAEVKGKWYDRLKIKLKLWRITVNLSSGLSEIAGNIIITVFKAIILILLIAIVIVILQPYISTYLAGRKLTAEEVTLLGGGGISAILLSLISVLVIPKAVSLLNLLDKNLNIDFSKFSNSLSYQEHISLIDRLNLEFRDIVKLAKGKEEPEKPIVIIIDDLDRCLPEKALQVIEGIKLFLDMEYCVYLFALDRDIIEKIVHVKYKDLNLADEEIKKARENYIEKLIQVSIPIPPIDKDRTKEFVKILYSKYDNIYGDYISDIFAQTLPHNPRKIKHIIQMYLVWREIADTMIKKNVICPILLAKIVVIQNQFKEIFNEIIENNLLLKALETSSLGEQLQLKEGDDKRTANISSVVIRAEGFLEKYPQLRDLLSKVEKGSRFDRCDIKSYIFLLRKLPNVSEPVKEDLSRVVSHDSTQFVSQEITSLFIPRQIPSPPFDFIGRSSELEELWEHFERGATILGIYGMGGIGKTALAFKLAEKLRDRYPDGQLMVDLRGTDQEPLKPVEAMVQIIHSFDHSIFLPKEENVLAGLYRSILGSKRALLLLDNAADDHQVQPLLPPSTCCVLITSRKKFTLPGLARMDLDTLNPSDARNLLIAISGRISDQTGELAQLCGYMPLALRAAGSLLANTTDLDLAKYVEELLAERTRLDRIGSKGVYLNVEASFNLSYRRLSAGAALTFQLTSIFPADFDARAEEIICLDEGHMQLSELVRWSLVEYQVSGEDGRYHLNNLARLFSNLKLEQENGPATMVAAQQRHAEHYRNVLSSSDRLYMQGGDGVLAGLKLFDLEWTNIQAGQAWAEKNLEGSSPAAALCSNYPAAGAYVLDLRLHPSEKIRWLMTALVAARQLKDRSIESVHLGNLGLAYAAMSDVRKAIEYYELALAIACEIGDRRGEGNALGNLGLAYADLGDVRKAIEYYEQALAIAREIGDRRNEGAWLGNLGLAYADLGEARKAIDYYEQALAIAREIGDRRGEGNALGNLGNAYSDLSEVRKAIDYYEQRLAIASEIGDRRGEGNALGNLGNAYAALGDFHKAIDYYEQHLAIACKIRDRRSEGAVLGNLGLAYADLGDARKAIEYYEKYLAIAREIRDRRGEGNALWNMSLALYSLDERAEAIKKAESALENYEQIESPAIAKVQQQLAEWRK